MAENFVYNHEHRILVCLICESCIVPTAKGLNNHFRKKRHDLIGPQLENIKDYLTKEFFHRLRLLDELQNEKLSERPAILGLKILQGHRCLQDGCEYATTSKKAATAHDRNVHSIYVKGSAPPRPSRWATGPMQTYFSNNLLRYFPVTVTASASALPIQEAPAEASHAVAATAMLASSEAKTRKADRQLRREGGIVPAVPADESARVPERVRPRPPLIYDEATLLAAARAVHKNPGLIFRTDQREGVLATLGPRPAEQVVLVLGPGAGKTLVVLVGTAVQGAETTILVLPTMAPSSDMQDRLNQHGIQYHVWTPASTPSAKVVLVSAEAACSESFLNYAHQLAGREQLDRIVVDECHLTVTATDRPCLRQLGRCVRQIDTQTVWLTATLSPSMESLFLERNHLVQPFMVRASTNRGNMHYCVHRTAASVLDSIAHLVDRFEPEPRPGGHEDRDRILVYCATRAMALDAAERLGCEAYAADGEDEIEKAAILRRWLAAAGGSNASRTLVATSALGISFKYPCIRLVVHVGRPWRMSDFAQESGQAGRDGLPAKSIIVVGYKEVKEVEHRIKAGPYDGDVDSKGRADDALDRHAMDMYLSSRYCLRGVLCEYLDDPVDWRWCMEPDLPCAVCRVVHQEPRPSGTEWLVAAYREDDNAADDAEAMV